MSNPTGPSSTRVFLVEDHLLSQRTAAPAHARRPADSDPAMLAHAFFPGVAFGEKRMLVARPPAPLHDLELAAKILGHPLGDLSPEGLVLFGESRVHRHDLGLGMRPPPTCPGSQ